MLNDLRNRRSLRWPILYMSSYTRSAALEIDHHHLFYRQRGCDGDGTSVALLMGASPEIAASILPNQSPRLLQWRLAAVLAVFRQQRSLRDFRRHPRRCVWPYIANAMRIRTKAARGLAMGTASPPSVRRAAPSWIIRKVHLVRGAGVMRDYYFADRTVPFPDYLAVMG